ncbi:hypothetical protein ACFFUB_13565 [Algimonas porphyrae]|uniref:DUF2059 domain-containing protein n=1 Tax=Algimonas porphyrae TaxID=1128113 RepID=A0ABQ5UY16_9PROT|nr:hypothetical protein [Algimonas porphyrae]GLQ19448.1 hypothetical protein GCM10007854_04030 [Algimonas porphyrae]
MKSFLITTTALLLPLTGWASDAAQIAPSSLTTEQTEQCVTLMSGFPDEGPESRYIFFRLSQALSDDITPELSQLMADYMTQNEVRRLRADFPMIDVIEDIADPVLRQAAPERTVAGMAHIAYFDALCGSFIQGQVDSLLAFRSDLSANDMAIREDALYLRQILSEALDRLGAGERQAVRAYTAALVTERDDIEYVGFADEIDELEALYMGDLDKRLARSNDAVNEGVNAETVQDAAALARDMDEQARENAKRERLFSLIRILGGIG